MELTVSTILSSMEAKCAYTADELAEILGKSKTEIGEMLCELVEKGFVRMSSDPSRVIRFEKLGPSRG
jgi:predicted transcriptional regulator